MKPNRIYDRNKYIIVNHPPLLSILRHCRAAVVHVGLPGLLAWFAETNSSRISKTMFVGFDCGMMLNEVIVSPQEGPEWRNPPEGEH